jgi:uncharacterized membrane protein
MVQKEMRDHSRIISLALIVAAFAVSLIAFPHLPPRLPTHWDMTGHANGFSGRAIGAFLLPCIMLGVWALLSFIPRYDRALFIRYQDRESDVSTVRPVYGVIVVAVLAMLLAIHAFAISSALGVVGPERQPLIIAVIASIGSVVIGNYMPRVTRRNAFIGFRVPWAYASEEVWRRTQRAGGYGMVLAGIVGLLGAFALPGAPFEAFLVAMVAQVVIVMIYSYRIAHSQGVD